MLNTDTEILFPLRVIPSLRNLRGEKWKDLIDRLSLPDVDESELAAFSLMMVRLGGCTACNADSFRAMRGCTHCARLSVRRYKGSDDDLLELFNNAREDLADYIKKNY
jgi:hypothetical protein